MFSTKELSFIRWEKEKNEAVQRSLNNKKGVPSKGRAHLGISKNLICPEVLLLVL